MPSLFPQGQLPKAAPITDLSGTWSPVSLPLSHQSLEWRTCAYTHQHGFISGQGVQGGQKVVKSKEVSYLAEGHSDHRALPYAVSKGVLGT